LYEIERCFAEREDIGIIGGDVRIARQDAHRPTLLEAYESVFAYRMREYIAKQGYTGTGNLAVRKQILAAVGPFGGIEIAEDRDWGQRALRKCFRTHYRKQM
ncbi:glycosyl transferase family 2, partial [Mesorhizobium sp. M1C.F.Ca.ET.144.01.1.1]